jgi:hypothetical protein
MKKDLQRKVAVYSSYVPVGSPKKEAMGNSLLLEFISKQQGFKQDIGSPNSAPITEATIQSYEEQLESMKAQVCTQSLLIKKPILMKWPI